MCFLFTFTGCTYVDEDALLQDQLRQQWQHSAKGSTKYQKKQSRRIIYHEVSCDGTPCMRSSRFWGGGGAGAEPRPGW